MVYSEIKNEYKLDLLFSSLSNPTRRNILKNISNKELTITDLSEYYDISLNMISKHIKILEMANLVTKKRKGRSYVIQLSPKPFKDAMDYLSFYKQFWEDKLDALGRYLEGDG